MLAIETHALMPALQARAALYWRSFITSIFVGVAGTVAGFLIGQSVRLGPWFPWSTPLQVSAGRADHMMQVVTVSLIGGALPALLDMWQFQHREQAWQGHPTAGHEKGAAAMRRLLVAQNGG
jgi:lantibiotic transport system permease protein